MNGFWCVRCLSETMKTGNPRPGASFFRPENVATFVIGGDTLCRTHAETAVVHRDRAYLTKEEK